MKAPVFITLPCATTGLEVTPTFAFSLILTPFAKRGIESCKIQLLQQVVLSALKCYFWKDIEIYDERCSLHPLAITGSPTWSSCYHTPARFQNNLLIKTLINRTHLSQTQNRCVPISGVKMTINVQGTKSTARILFQFLWYDIRQNCSTWKAKLVISCLSKWKYNLCCLIVIYTVLTQNPFCLDLHTFVWSKHLPENLCLWSIKAKMTNIMHQDSRIRQFSRMKFLTQQRRRPYSGPTCTP